MPIYKVEAPDGRILEIEGPDNATEDQILGFASQSYKSEQIKPESGFIPSVKRGARGVSSLVGDVLPAMAAKFVGADEYAKQQMQEAAAYQKETEAKYPAAVPSYTNIKGPGDFVTYAVEAVGEALPSILPGLFTGGVSAILSRGAVVAAKMAAEKAAMSSVAQGATEAAVKEIALKAGIDAAKREALKYTAAGTVVGSATQNIPDVYQGLYEKGNDDLGAALIFGGFNSALDAITPFNLLRKAKLSGIPEQQLIGAWYKRAGKGALEGFASESATETLQEMSSVAAEKFVNQNNEFFTPQNFERFINAGLKGGLGGAGLTAAANVATGRAGAPGEAPATGEAPTTETPIAPTPNQGTDAPVTMAGVAPVEEPPRTAFAPPVVPPIIDEPPAPPAPPGIPPPPTPPNIPPPNIPPPNIPPPFIPPTGGGGTEQNRDRSRDAYVAQMNGIANNLDYDRVAVEPRMTGGAPIVTGPAQIPQNQLGKKSNAIAEDGLKMPVQYAVVDAGDILASHNVDGTANEQYKPDFQGLRSVVGNGRTAGLQAAYARGTAEDYRNRLINDDAHGVDKTIIEGMKNPVLVRYSDPSVIPANIGDISNTPGTLSLSTVEQARNDANRVDLSNLNFGDDGEITNDTIRDFVQRMPESERNTLMDDKGSVTRVANDRLNAAIFHMAYGDDALTHLAHEKNDEESKNIINAISEAAPQMAALPQSNEMDIRPAVVDAVRTAVNARRNGIKLSDMLKQQDMTTNPLTNNILQLFADNPRSPRKIAESLKGLATKINEEIAAPTQDLFGARTKKTLQQIINEHFQIAGASPAVQEIRGYQIDKPREQIHAEVKQMKNHVQLAQWTVDNAPNRFAKHIAEKVLDRVQQFQQMNIPMKVEVQDGSRRPRNRFGQSAYDPKDGGSFKIQLSGLNDKGVVDSLTGTRYSTILHELIHSVTQTQFWVLGTYARKKGYMPSSAFIDMGSLLTIIKKQAKKDGITDNDILKGLKNVDELIAHGLTNEKFQDYMAGIKVGPKNAFTKMIEIIRSVLGIDPQYETALDQLMRVTERTLAPSIKEVSRDTAKVGIQLGRSGPAPQGMPDSNLGEITSNETIVPDFGGEEGSKYFKAQTVEAQRQGYANSLKNPITLRDGTRLSGFTDPANQTTFHGYGKNGERITMRRELVNPNDIVFSKDNNKTAEYFRQKLAALAEGLPLEISSQEEATVERLTKTTPAQTGGQAVRQAATAAWNNVQNNNYRTGLRVAWIDKNSGLTRSLASQPTFDMNGQLRADMLARTQDQMINWVNNGLQTGLPMINSDGTLGIQRSENNLARSQIVADKLDGKMKLNGETLSGRDAVAEIARALRGKDILAEDVKRRAKGQQQSALAKELIKLLKVARDPKNLNPETDRPYTIREMQQILRGVKYLRREASKNIKMNRELQVTPELIAWAEAQLPNHPEAQQVLDIWKNVNNSLVTLWEKTGLFTKEQADDYRSRDNYVPLFKSREDLANDPNGYGGTGTKTVKTGKALIGSLARRNIWENLDKHYAAMVASAYQNQTRKVATGQLKALGLAEIPEKATDPRVNLRYRDPTDPFADSKGIVSAIIQNPNDLAAFQMMHYELGPLLKISAATTKVLRAGALINPMYWIKQLVRDPIHASLVADSGIVTPFHAAKEYINILTNNSEEAKILASRGVIGQVDSTIDIHDFLKQVGTARNDPNVMQKMMHKVMRMHEASDAATRVSIYKNEYAAAKAKGMSDAHAMNYAVHKARESINFAVHGNSPTLNALRHMVPFLSAAITSLDTVYRAATGYGKSPEEKAQAQKLFITRAAMMAAMCTAYAMAYQNDDDYKKLPDYVKDNNWLIPNPFGDGHSFIKIPTPFEVGFLFKTVPEAAVRYMYGTSTGKEVVSSYLQGLAHNLPGGSIPPISLIPQALKPIIETQANYSFFTGRPIEGMGDQGLPIAARGERASELAKILSRAGLDSIKLSPAKIDYLIQGYMAELGTFTTGMASDAIYAAQGKTRPERNIEEMPFNKAFMTNPNSSKAVADYYELTNNAQDAVTFMNRMKGTGQVEELQDFLANEQNVKNIGAAPYLRDIGTKMTEIRKAMTFYKNNQILDPVVRRNKINELEALYHQTAAQGYKVASAAGINR